MKAQVADGSVVEIEVYGVPDDTMARLRGSRASGQSASRNASRRSSSWCRPLPGAELTHSLLAQLDGASVGRVSSREPTLEDAYVALVESA